MDKNLFNTKYKNVSNKVLDVLIDNKCSSLFDIKLIFNMIMGFPYMIDEEGHYTYRGEYYEELKSIPLDGLKALLSRYEMNDLIG
ncbi:MAG: hypothetical protein MRZ66_01600 [Clostridiales bacterium]|nr:hypothetical protein [Clostridiales bacterium]